jgi:demethylmenaquinone methyltransferase / 2-methoxy-6-polyprenyl-1,4-benzoquinol methylase
LSAPDRTGDRIEGMFDAIAPRYDFLNRVLSAGIDRRWRRIAIESLSLTGVECMLDLCTGTADLAIAAAKAAPAPARIAGVDFAGKMLGIGREKVARLGASAPILLVRGDATRIPLADRSVDCVTIAFGIRNVENTEAACAEIGRVLAPGGRIAILEFAIPTVPVVRALYLWYFKVLLPLVGRLVSRHNAAYGYLPASVEAFPAPAEFVKILRAAGLAQISARPLTLGIVYLYTGHRAAGL